MKFDINSIISKIKDNKKIAIIVGVAIVLVLALLILGGKGNNNQFLATIEEIHTQSYVADGTLTITDKVLNVNINKSESDFIISMQDDDIAYNEIFAKIGNSIYINDETVEENGGLITITTQETEESVIFFDVLFQALSEDTFATITQTENESIFIIDKPENWKGFWTNLNTAITNNSVNLAAGYQQKEEMTNIINSLASYFNTLAITDTTANALKITLITNESDYKLNFELTLDISLLPSFANKDDIDSNKVKILGEFTITPIEASSLSKPSGAIHAVTSTGVDGFFSAFWSKLFEKAEYISFAEVTATNNTVSAVYKLGEVTETLQLVFNGNGVTQGIWYLTSNSQELLEDYIEKYGSKFKENNDFRIEEISEKEYSLTIEISDSGINSYNKIAKTANEMAEFLKSPKGGDIIV